MQANVNTHVTLSAIVYRKDGTVEDLGVICDSDNNPKEKPDKTIIEKLRGMLKHG